MSSVTVSAINDEERRFELWMSRLQQSFSVRCAHRLLIAHSIYGFCYFQTYLSFSGEGGADGEALLQTIRETVQSDQSDYPQWVAAHKNLKLAKLASSSSDLKVFLRHVTFPGVLQSYRDFCEGLGSAAQTEEQHDSAAAAGAGGSLGMVPMSTKTGQNEAAVRRFFQGISRGSADGLVDLCKLADLHHRVNRAAEHDSAQVSTWLSNERARGESSERSLVDRQQRLACLRGEDEHRAVEAAVGGLKVELGVLGEELQRAEDEEEQARKVRSSVVALCIVGR